MKSQKRGSGGTTVVTAAKKRLKKDKAKFEEALVEEIRNYSCLWNTSWQVISGTTEKAVCMVLDSKENERR